MTLACTFEQAQQAEDVDIEALARRLEQEEEEARLAQEADDLKHAQQLQEQLDNSVWPSQSLVCLPYSALSDLRKSCQLCGIAYGYVPGQLHVGQQGHSLLYASRLPCLICKGWHRFLGYFSAEE